MIFSFHLDSILPSKTLDFEPIHLEQNPVIAAELILEDKKHLENNPKKIYKDDIVSLLELINSGKMFDA